MDVESLSVGVIDDDPGVRKALARLLRTTGHRVEVFESAERFLDRPAHTWPDCLILDVNLDGMSGLDLYERLRGVEKPRRVVFITGRDDGVVEELERRAPGSTCLFKPFDEATLLAGIRGR